MHIIRQYNPYRPPDRQTFAQLDIFSSPQPASNASYPRSPRQKAYF